MQYKLFCGTHVSVGEWFSNTEGAEIDWNRRTTDKTQPDFYLPTKADRVRGMNDEELAVFFAKVNAALYRADLPVIAYRGEKVNKNLDWLRQPEEE